MIFESIDALDYAIAKSIEFTRLDSSLSATLHVGTYLLPIFISDPCDRQLA